mmetsp:Transcript_24028/g.52338  ORF Transcript_24028/g.52338 Transcript_24028/m.52338 type:complete len:282 (-) Transcript_24028:376-1221(-)
MHFVVSRYSPAKKKGELLLIDLAGSERNKDSWSHSAKLRREGAEINSSLMALKNCFRAQATNQPFVPFRASLLTRILKRPLTDRNSKTAVIATVSPAAGDTEHTISTLTNVSVMLESPTQGSPEKLSKGQESTLIQRLPTQDIQSVASIEADTAYIRAQESHPKRWTSGRVQEWWEENAPKAVKPPANVTGHMLMRWSIQRFIQHFQDHPETPTRISRSGSTSSSSPVPSPSTRKSPKPSKNTRKRQAEGLYYLFRQEVQNVSKHKERRAKIKRSPIPDEC